MKYLNTILISFFVAISVVGFAHFFTLPGVGTTVTQISGSDKLSDLDTLINTVSSELNVGKMEISTTTLPLLTTLVNLVTVGALNSGSLTSNFSAIPVLIGGTGTTAPTVYRTMMGDGANGFTVASTTGTSGQFWTSGGAGAYSSWTTSSINETDNYNFTGTIFNIKNLFASSTVANPLVLNTVSYNLPSLDGASSTSLQTDGSGGLTWNPSSELATTTTSGASIFSSTASTTVFTFSVPANILGTNGAIHIRMSLSDLQVGSSNDIIFAELNYGGSKQNMFIINTTNSDATLKGIMEVDLIASNATGAQESTITLHGMKPGITLNSVDTDNTAFFVESASHTVDSTSAQTFSLIMRNSVSEAQTGFTIDNIIGEYIR